MHTTTRSFPAAAYCCPLLLVRHHMRATCSTCKLPVTLPAAWERQYWAAGKLAGGSLMQGICCCKGMAAND